MSNDNVPSQTERAFRERFQSFDRRLKEIERRLTGLGAVDASVIGGGAVDHFTVQDQYLLLAPGNQTHTSSVFTFTPSVDSPFIWVLFTTSMGVTAPLGGVRTWQGGMTLEVNHPVFGWTAVTGVQPRALIGDDSLQIYATVPGEIPIGVAPAGVPIQMRVQYSNDELFAIGATAGMNFIVSFFVWAT